MKKYKSGKLFVGLSFSCLICFCQLLYAWENKVTHPAITKKSVNSNTAIVDDYLKTQLGLSDGLSTQLYWNFPTDIKNRMTENKKVDPNKTKTILDWLRAGSTIEDEDGRGIPWRPRHHFYDPTRNTGLDNHTAYPEWDAPGWSHWLPLGTSTLHWAIDGNAVYEPSTNNDKWSDAREAFYNSLTAQDSNDRQTYLAASMVKLGCVLHLLEDMGVPAHTRNDFLYGHYRSAYKLDYGNDLEKNVETKIIANNGDSLWNGNGAVVFDKLAKYFDTDTRNPYNYLGSGILPPETWGLAEATNYQFWSLSTINSSLPKYYFEHPHLAYMGTDIEEGTADKKLYLNGVNYGVSHIARKSYTYYYTEYHNIYGTMIPETKQKIDSTITTDDEKVFDDYATITIPRTIDYATGLANYFFRGQVQLRSAVDSRFEDLLSVTLYIKNKSMLEANPLDYKFGFKGGQFEVYWDDANGNRTEIPGITLSKTWNAASTLAYDEEMRISFNDTTANDLENAVRFIVVYKGNILKQSEYITDENDTAAIAVAVIDANHIHNIPTTNLILAKFNNVNEDWFDPAEMLNNQGFQLHYVGPGWQANEDYTGRVIDMTPTYANNQDRVWMHVEDDYNGNWLFQAGNFDTLEYFPHVIENAISYGWCSGTCTISLWNMQDWQNGVSYTEGKQVGWSSPEGDCFEVYTCTLNHTSSSSNQPGQGSNWEDYWLLGYPSVSADCDIDGISENNEESPGGTVQISGALKKINTLILSSWPDVWTNELNRGSATLRVVTGANKIRVWDNSSKTGQPLITSDNPEKIWQLSSETMPSSLYVEGVSASDSAMDVRLKFIVNYAGIKVYDKINFTVQN
jgi:hypothetical protein